MRCDWSLPIIYQSTDTWMTSRETCFLCFVQHGARFWKCLWDYFGLKQVKSSKKVRQELFTRQKNGETGTKWALDYLRMPELQEIFTTAADRVSSLWQTRRFAKCFRHYSALSKKRRWKKNFSKKLYSIKLKKKRKSRDESDAWDYKLAQILEQ